MEADESARRGVEAMLAADVASTSLGIELVDVAVGHAELRMTVRPDMVNGYGICHGGYLFLFADTAFSCACNTHGVVTVAAGADILFTTPAREGDVLTATAVERLRYGRGDRLGLCHVTVTRGDGTTVAAFAGRSSASREPIQTAAGTELPSR